MSFPIVNRNQGSSISQGQNSFSQIVQQAESDKRALTSAFDEIKSSAMQEGFKSGATRVFNSGAAAAFHGYIQIFSSIDGGIAQIMTDLLVRMGIPSNVFFAAQCLLQSDSIGKDPHEKLGVPVWKYNIIEEVHQLMRKAEILESSHLNYSAKIDHKRQIHERIAELYKELRQ